MADPIETLTDAINRLISALAPIADFSSAWKLREQQPGLYSKIPVAVPFRPSLNNTIILNVGVADVFSVPLLQGTYDLTADTDMFIALNGQANANGGYLLRAGLAYGGLRVVSNDVLHAICPTAGAGTTPLYIMPVE
jgi:hypothetical protein